MFTRVLRRVRLSITYVGQWRRKCAVDSISKPQLQNGFKESWKLFWIRAHVSDLNQPPSSDKFDSFGIMTVKKTISRWPDKF